MNMNADNRIVLNPNSVEHHCDLELPSPNTIDRRCSHERQVQLDEEISQFLGHNERQLNQFSFSDYHPNGSHSIGNAQTALRSSNSRCSPPPPYDLCVNILNPAVQPAQYTHQILQFPQQQNVQYLHQHRLQYPQQESLQYHEEILHYPQHRMEYPCQRDANYSTSYQPPIKSTNWLCCWFFILPVCLLMFLLYFFATTDF